MKYTTAIAIIIVAIAVSAAFVFWFAPRAALVCYLTAVITWSAISIGSLAVLLLTYLVRGEWTKALHDSLRGAAMTMPISALLFVPILIGIPLLYPWAAHGVAEPGSFKAFWLTPWFFALRTMIYFAIWTALTYWAVLAWNNSRRMNRIASIGLIIYALTASLAGVDWIESLAPEFHSSVYGLTFLTFQMLAAFAFASFVALKQSDANSGNYGATFLSIILLWGYNYAMQYIVIWSANIPSEVGWYVSRSSGFWGWMLIVLVVGQFIIPFFALLCERVRNSARLLSFIAALSVAMRFFEAAWLIAGNSESDILWLVIATPIMIAAIGAVWLNAFRYAAGAMMKVLINPTNKGRLAAS